MKFLYSILFLVVFSYSEAQSSWRFIVLGDTHVGSSDTVAEMIPFMLEDSVDFVAVVGDLVEGGLGTPGTQLLLELETWKSIFSPLYNSGIPVYGLRGNHENDANNDINIWNTAFSDNYSFPQNGPIGEENLTYAVTHKNAKLLFLDVYKNMHQVNQNWLNNQLDTNTRQHVFSFGHEAAFKVFHADCLDDSLNARNVFWNSLSSAGCRVYFCGHDHFLDASLVDNGDGNAANDVYQYLVGTGGGWLMSQYSNYNGNNGPFVPNRLFHEMEFGYALVEVSDLSNPSCQVKINWKRRTQNGNGIQTYQLSEHEILIESCSNGLDESNTIEFKVFPNPSNGRVYFNSPLLLPTTLMDTYGKVLISLPENSTSFSTEGFAPGIYFIKNQRQTFPIAVQ